MMKFTWLLMLTTAALFMTALTASAQFAFDGDGPIKVDGDKIEYNGDETILTGQVEITQGATRILADTVVLYRNMLATGQPGDVSRIVATGNFIILRQSKRCAATKGSMFKRVIRSPSRGMLCWAMKREMSALPINLSMI